jgi:hypothetical protein
MELMMIRELNSSEIDSVNGGWFWLALPIVIGGGYTLGKDRAERDNKRDEKNKTNSKHSTGGGRHLFRHQMISKTNGV